MMRGALLIASLWAGMASGAVPAPEDWEELPPISTSVGPCVPGAAETLVAKGLLSDLTDLARRLSTSRDAEQFREKLKQLDDHVCLAGIRDFRYMVGLDKGTAGALREWWAAGGGRWLESLLTYDPVSRTVLFPPHVRRHVNPHEDPAWAWLACEPGASECESTSSWWSGENAALRAKHLADSARWSREIELRGDTGYERYLWWTLETDRRLGYAMDLPGGRFRAPREGWLFIRDTNDGCTSIKAFSLSDGKVWLTDDCKGARVRTGVLPVASIRRFALLTIFAGEDLPGVRREAMEAQHPPDVPPSWEWPTRSIIGGIVGGRTGCCRGPWEFAWSVATPATTVGRRLGNKRSSRPIQNRFVRERMAELEGALTPSCLPPQEPPAERPRVGQGTVFDTPATPDKDPQRLFAPIWEAMRRPPADCGVIEN